MRINLITVESTSKALLFCEWYLHQGMQVVARIQQYHLRAHPEQQLDQGIQKIGQFL